MITTLDGFTQRLVSANGIRINGVTGGDGPPVLLLHGFPETWWEWHHVMPLLAKRFSVVAVDLRGAGFSDCPLDGYDKATLARDVHEVMIASATDRRGSGLGQPDQVRHALGPHAEREIECESRDALVESALYRWQMARFGLPPLDPDSRPSEVSDLREAR